MTVLPETRRIERGYVQISMYRCRAANWQRLLCRALCPPPVNFATSAKSFKQRQKRTLGTLLNTRNSVGLKLQKWQHLNRQRWLPTITWPTCRAWRLGKIPLLDVKLDSVQAIRPLWGYLHQKPFFMDVLDKQGCTFLFIRRRDLVEQIVSEHIARAANKWHELVQKDIQEPISINVDQARDQARLILQSEAFFFYCLKPSNHMIAIEYDDIFIDGFVNQRLILELGEKMEIKIPT